jgi:hypothetical protein
MLALALHSKTGVASLRLHVVESQYSVDINDRESSRVTVHLKLLRSASKLKLVLKLDVWQCVLMDDTAHSSNDESIVACGDAANEIKAANIWLLPSFSVVDSVGVWKFLNVESILFSRLLLLLLLKRLHLGVRRSILPVVNDIIRCNDNMSIVHCHIFWLNADILAVDGAANSVAELNHPGISNQVGLGELGHKNAVVTAGLDIAERLHVLD